MSRSLWSQPEALARAWRLAAVFLGACAVTVAGFWLTDRGGEALLSNEESIAADQAVRETLALGRWHATLVRCADGASGAHEALAALTPEVRAGIESVRQSGLLGGVRVRDELPRRMSEAAAPPPPGVDVAGHCARHLRDLGDAPLQLMRQGQTVLAEAERLRSLAVRQALGPRWIARSVAALLLFSLAAALLLYLTAYRRVSQAGAAKRDADNARRAAERDRALAEMLVREKDEALEAADRQRRISEDALRRAERAERDKITFLGMATHEIRTPLHTLLIAVSTLRDRGQVDVQDPLFQRLGRSASQLEAQVADLIDFAELTSGRMSIKTRSFVMGPVVEYILEAYSEELDAKNLSVEWRPDAALAEPIESDPKRLRQILTNLVSNAIKYTTRGGIEIEVRLNADRSELSMVVEDTGSGIPADKLEQIFEPYVRVTTADLEVKGHGLGLAVVKKLVEALEGRISVRSTPGSGSRFEVVVPINARAQPPASVHNETQRRRLLLVEDDVDILVDLDEQLRQRGWELLAATQVKRALQALERTRFDVLLIDLNLPDGSGLEVAHAAALLDPKPRLVLFSANAFTLSADERGLFDAIVSKPAVLTEIEAALLG